MIDELFKTKLKRTIWVSLLEQNSIVEGVSFYQKYRVLLSSLSDKYIDDKNIEKEIKDAENIFQKIITKKGIDNFNAKNYTLACYCFASLAETEDLSGDILKKYIFCLFELNQDDIAKELLKSYQVNEKETGENLKCLSDWYEKIGFFRKSCFYMEKYLKSKENKTSRDYIQYARKLHTFYKNTQKLSAIELAIQSYEIAIRIFGKTLYTPKDIAYYEAEEILHKACSGLLEIGNLSYIYSDLITIFANVGMLNEQVYCFEMLFNSADNNEINIVNLLDRYRAIAQIISYFNQYKMFESVLYANEYLQKLEKIIYDFLKDNTNINDYYKNEITEIKNYIAEGLSLNEYNLRINELAIELNPDCEQAYLNILEDYISNNDLNIAYEFYDKYCNQFNKYKEISVPDMLWQLSSLYHDKNLHFKSVKYQKYAAEYELEHGVST